MQKIRHAVEEALKEFGVVKMKARQKRPRRMPTDFEADMKFGCPLHTKFLAFIQLREV